jgi:hypothetical protein
MRDQELRHSEAVLMTGPMQGRPMILNCFKQAVGEEVTTNNDGAAGITQKSTQRQRVTILQLGMNGVLLKETEQRAIFYLVQRIDIGSTHQEQLGNSKRTNSCSIVQRSSRKLNHQHNTNTNNNNSNNNNNVLEPEEL